MSTAGAPCNRKWWWGRSLQEETGPSNQQSHFGQGVFCTLVIEILAHEGALLENQHFKNPIPLIILLFTVSQRCKPVLQNVKHFNNVFRQKHRYTFPSNETNWPGEADHMQNKAALMGSRVRHQKVALDLDSPTTFATQNDLLSLSAQTRIWDVLFR